MIKPLFQKIVVAVNGSEQSIEASMYAIMMAKTLKCEMKAVYVVDTATLKQLEMLKFLHSVECSRYQERLNNDGERYLASVVQLAKEKGVKIQTEMRHGAVWAEIEKCADEFGADLILLGAKRFGNSLQRDKISATNSEIIGSSTRNVLVVKDREVEKKFKIL